MKTSNVHQKSREASSVFSQKRAAELHRGGGPWAEEIQFCCPQKTQAECCRWWKLEEFLDSKPEDYDHLLLNWAN